MTQLLVAFQAMSFKMQMFVSETDFELENDLMVGGILNFEQEDDPMFDGIISF